MTRAKRAVILDACVAISFGNAHALEVVVGLLAHDILIGPRARSEVSRDPAGAALEQAIRSGRIRIVKPDLDDGPFQRELVRFDRMPAYHGTGEAEVLALAVTREFLVASDELAVRRTVFAELGAARLVTSLDILVWAVREGRLERTEAENLLGRLDIGDAIRRTLQKRGVAFTDLL